MLLEATERTVALLAQKPTDLTSYVIVVDSQSDDATAYLYGLRPEADCADTTLFG